MEGSRVRNGNRAPTRTKKAASGAVRTPQYQICGRRLKCEIHACANHAEVVVRPIYKIPTEVTDPTDVRRKADLHAAANLTECLGLAARETLRLDNIKGFAKLADAHIFWPLPATKNTATASKDVWRKPGARNWITQRQ